MKKPSIGGTLDGEYDNIPDTATLKPARFRVKIPPQEVKDLKTLVSLSKIGPKTYENLDSSRKFGISHAWLTEAKTYWEKKFDWCVGTMYSV